MVRPTEQQIAAGRRKLRREGMADAAVLLVARRFHPSATLDNLGDLLGLNVIEVQAAVRRFQALTRPDGPPRDTPAFAPPRRTPRTPLPAEGPAGRLADHLRQHGPYTSDDGRGITAALAAAVDVTPSRINQLLVQGEAAGQIRRTVRGRRTFLVEWVGP